MRLNLFCICRDNMQRISAFTTSQILPPNKSTKSLVIPNRPKCSADDSRRSFGDWLDPVSPVTTKMVSSKILGFLDISVTSGTVGKQQVPDIWKPGSTDRSLCGEYIRIRIYAECLINMQLLSGYYWLKVFTHQALVTGCCNHSV